MFVIRYILAAVLIFFTIPMAAAGCTSGKSPEPTGTTAAQTSPTSSVVINQVIDTQAAYDMIQSNQENPDFVILDVRTKAEFDSGHISGATLIDVTAPDFRTKVSELDRNKKYLVYCRTARRSADAAKIMQELEFREVYDMAGGINQWSQNGFPTVTN